MQTNLDLAALSEAATKRAIALEVCAMDSWQLTLVFGTGDEARDAMRKWSNAYRSGDLVLIEREGMRERVADALLKEEETNWNVTLGLDEDVSDLADAAIAAILGEG